MTYDYDLFVIGAGSGGVRAARIAAQSGAKVAVAEEFRTGGTCVIRGCVPKKFMVYASEYKTHFKEAEGFGFSFPKQPTYDHTRFIASLAAEVDRLSGIYRRNLNNAGVDVIDDRAVFEDAHTLRLVNSDKTVTAEKILIAVGGEPFIPSDTIEGCEHAITSNEIFDIEDLPRSITIGGGGYIAVEFAHIFAGLGVETSLVYRGDLILRGFDDDIREAVRSGLLESGVRVITHANYTKINETPEGPCKFHVELDNGHAINADVVMLALGRIPYTANLGCDKVGIKLDKRGAVVVDEWSKTNVDSVWAVGDVTDRVALTPVAIREGHCFADTEFGGKPHHFDHDKIASAIFTQPPVGTVGMSEHDARAKYGDVDIYKARFKPMKSALSGDPNRVLMKLIVRQSDQVVLGCHIVGPDAPEIIQAVGIAVKMNATKQDFDNTCALHPSLAEELVTMRDKWVPPEL
ncbi:MAG: glutathione-disulfide reductase [Hirschia sp.]|nr:glutathione-disulfide reductase [Hirschia sp.]MBF18357.1 glutathione-disulfide reductase [Hirschia sp.]